MLNIIRKNAQSFVIQAVVIIIAVVFIFWGVNSQLKNPSNAMAVVNGQEIGYREFMQSYERAVEQYKEQFGGQMPDKFLESIRLKEQVLDQLVQRTLLLQGAEEIGLRVSKEAIQRKIQAMEVFAPGGRFDESLYRTVLERNHLSAKTFESGLRDDLLTKQADEMIGAFAELPASEVEQWVDYLDQEIKLAYVQFSADKYRTQVQVTPEALDAWYGGHQQQYKSTPQVKLSYLGFAFADEAKPELVSDEAIRSLYQDRLSQYHTPEQRRARHILLKVDEGAAAEVKAAKRASAEQILAQLRQGADFAALAKQHSEDSSKERGGDLGFFRSGQMVAPFEQSAFSLKKGEISDIVTSPFGYHIIKLEEIRPAATRSLEEVVGPIRKELGQKQGQADAFKKASTTYEEIIRAGSLAKFSEQGKLPIQQTDFFAQDNPPKTGMAADSAFMQAAFALRKGELSSIVETATGYAIIFADDTKEPTIPPLDTVRSKVVADFTKEKSNELARAAAEASLKKALETNAWPEGVEKKEADYVKRSGAAPAVPDALRRDAFGRLGRGVFPEQVLAEGDSYALYQILDVRKGKSDIDAAKREAIKAQLQAGQEKMLLAAILGQLRKEAKIWTNAKMLQ